MSAQRTADTWELRHRWKAVVLSSVPYCGYSPEQLKSLAQNGYRLYLNGEPYSVKRANGDQPVK